MDSWANRYEMRTPESFERAGEKRPMPIIFIEK